MENTVQQATNRRTCPSCEGNELVSCPECGGGGGIWESGGGIAACEQCGGDGTIPCPECGGTGVLRTGI